MDAKTVLHRVTLRGLVKCKACNHFNGIRANSCKNKACTLSRTIVKRKPKSNISSIQLISMDDSKLFSVQTRERDTENRNFVSITDKIISSDANGSIISRNAICYVDTCKYDSNDVNISCKHVKSSMELCTTKAKVEKIDFDVLNAFQMDPNQKQKLWNFYKVCETTVPMVQRISPTMFVVRCDISANFPAGLLHVICSMDSNGARYSCACKKMKILMSSNKVIYEKDTCEHLVLVFVAIMSDMSLKQEFKFILAEVQPHIGTDIILLDPDADMESIETTAYDELSNTTIENLDNIELIQVPNIAEPSNNVVPPIEFDGDENIQSIDMENIPIVDHMFLHSNCEVNNDNQFDLGLIKVLEQSNVVEIDDQNTIKMDHFFQMNDGLHDMNDITSWNTDSNEFSTLCDNGTLIDNSLIQPTYSSIKPLKNPSTGKVSMNLHHDEGTSDMENDHQEMLQNLDPIEIKMYSNWMNSVIERLKNAMDFSENGDPEPITFSIPHMYFHILKTKFSAGTKKKRLPNHTIIIDNGKYKGLTLFSWIFSNIKLVKYIFSTETMQLETMRAFTRTHMNTYEPFEPSETTKLVDKSPSSIAISQLRKIRPTIYRTFLKVKNVENGKSGKYGLFSIEWIPNVLTKSQFGEMRIKLRFGHMKNDEILNENISC